MHQFRHLNTFIWNKKLRHNFTIGQNHKKASPPVFNQFQNLVQEKEALVQQTISPQDEITRLTEEIQKDKRDMEIALSELKRMMSQTQEKLDLMTVEKQDILTLLRQKQWDSQHLQEENNHLQQYNARLQDEKDVITRNKGHHTELRLCTEHDLLVM